MGRLVDRIGARLPLTVGPALVGAGFLLLTPPGITRGPGEFWTTFLPGVVGLGLGMGITIAPLTTAVMGAISSQQAGIASAVNNAVTRSAQVLALAALGGVALVTFSTALQAGSAGLGLPAAARQALLANSGKLGRTPIPPDLDATAHAAVHRAIQLAFVDAFRVVLLIAAGLCVVSAVLSWLLVDPREAGVATRPAPGASKRA